jgi:hypothetical protein
MRFSLLIPLLPSLALLANPAGAQNLQTLFAGSEIYRTQAYGAAHVRYDRLNLEADGTFSGDALIERSLSWTITTEERSIIGRWRIVGNRFCLAEAPAAYKNSAGRESCYDLKKLGVDGVYVDFRGTEVGTGLPWLFKVAPAG